MTGNRPSMAKLLSFGWGYPHIGAIRRQCELADIEIADIEIESVPCVVPIASLKIRK